MMMKNCMGTSETNSLKSQRGLTETIFPLTLCPWMFYFNRPLPPLSPLPLTPLPLCWQTSTNVRETPCCVVEGPVWTRRGVTSVNVPPGTHSAPTDLPVKVAHTSCNTRIRKPLSNTSRLVFKTSAIETLVKFWFTCAAYENLFSID